MSAQQIVNLVFLVLLPLGLVTWGLLAWARDSTPVEDRRSHDDAARDEWDAGDGDA